MTKVAIALLSLAALAGCASSQPAPAPTSLAANPGKVKQILEANHLPTTRPQGAPSGPWYQN